MTLVETHSIIPKEEMAQWLLTLRPYDPETFAPGDIAYIHQSGVRLSFMKPNAQKIQNGYSVMTKIWNRFDDDLPIFLLLLSKERFTDAEYGTVGSLFYCLHIKTQRKVWVFDEFMRKEYVLVQKASVAGE